MLLTLTILFFLTLDNLLFFGCRSVEQDFYWEEEWEKLVRDGSLILKVAASRDQVSIISYILPSPPINQVFASSHLSHLCDCRRTKYTCNIE